MLNVLNFSIFHLAGRTQILWNNFQFHDLIALTAPSTRDYSTELS